MAGRRQPPPPVPVLLLVIAVLVPCAYAIKCFQCNSKLDDGCKQLSVNDTDSKYYKECDGDYEGKPPFCRKTELQLNGTERVMRSCGWQNHTIDCYNIDDGHHVEKVCQCFEDACNLAPTHRVATLGTTLVGVGVVLRLML